MILIKNVECYAPEYLGKNDILICNGKIVEIGKDLDYDLSSITIFDGMGKRAVPGFIDQHVHITGGGGESGFASRVPEVQLSQCIRAGVTTVIGLLGTDSRTRSVENLVAKTKGLNEEGITAYCLTGAYDYPSPTITGSVAMDMIYINEVIGVKLAISDHRSSNVTIKQLTHLASEVRTASMIGKKPGVLHLHVGTGQEGLAKVINIVENTEIPITHFRPTHIREHTPEIEKFISLGGYVDFTSGNNVEETAQRIVNYLKYTPAEQITLSSDANGSQPIWNEHKELIGLTAAKIDTLYGTIQHLVLENGLDWSQALSFITSNVAKALKLYPTKGAIQSASDGDIVLLNDKGEIDTVFAKGQLMMENGNIVVKGTFE